MLNVMACHRAGYKPVFNQVDDQCIQMIHDSWVSFPEAHCLLDSSKGWIDDPHAACSGNFFAQFWFETSKNICFALPEHFM